MIKLIALDLDGTLLTSDKRLTETNYKALERAAAMGIQIVPCTGRFYEAMPECIKNLPFVNYTININGSEMFDVKNRQSVGSFLMSNDTVLEVADYLNTLPVLYDSYFGNWGYISKYHYENVSDYVRNPFYIENLLAYRTPVDDLREYIKNAGCGIQKIQFCCKDRDVVIEGTTYLTEHFPDCAVTSSWIDDCEVNDKNATKGNALLKLADHLGIRPEETMAFGDGGNDISMLKAAGIGVAMGNAKDKTLAAGDFVTKSCDEDGVAYALEKFVF